ncbi:MAG: cation diffusion facilitator family transporter [Henriciella sp.]|nr:cation diffusion facilitator family transporter [Henriciella sp.]
MGASHPHHDQSDPHNHHALLDTQDGRRRTAIAAVLTFTFMIVEIVGGLISGSLALLADAAHMLTDTGSLALAWLGFRLAEHPADDYRSFGWARFKVLAAFVNGLALIVLAVWIAIEAVSRLLNPHPVMGGLLFGVAFAGLIVNCIAFWVLHGGDHDDLNMQGAIWHVAGDMLGSVAAIGAAIVILSTGWMPIDPLLSLLVALIISFGGYRLVRKTGHILIEGVPAGLSTKAIKADLEAQIPGAVAVDHIHAWALNESKALVTVDVTASEAASTEAIRRAVKARLKSAFGVEHVTVEVISPE